MMNEPVGEGEGMEALLQQLAGEMGGERPASDVCGFRGCWTAWTPLLLQLTGEMGSEWDLQAGCIAL